MESTFGFLVILSFIVHCYGHGRMMRPPSRNAMWRFPQFKSMVLPNYNDNEQNCGGFAKQWIQNKGKCGVCGDEHSAKLQDHVHPGKYATGIISKTYTQGQRIEIHIDITSNHQGWFEFRVADIGNAPITQIKLDANILKVVGAKGHPHRYEIPAGSMNQVFKVFAVLPANLVCNHCVMQWWWKTGNSWGCDNTGCGIGKGRQEMFVNCADIQIMPKGTNPKSVLPTPRIQTRKPTTRQIVTDGITYPQMKNCVAAGAWRSNPKITEWCKRSCPYYCPSSHCTCT